MAREGARLSIGGQMSISAPDIRLASQVGELLRSRGLTLALAESATGGLVSSLVTSVAGSSAYFRGSIVAYDNEAKVRLLGVSRESLARYGAVSEVVAVEMARGARDAFAARVALADTGIAGPGGATEGKPVGLFYIALATDRGAQARRYALTGERLQIQQQAALAALEWLREYLLAEAGWST